MKIEECKICGHEHIIDKNTSDGYHTFGELYHHRAILFSVICHKHKEDAWKSKLHHDGTMFDEDMFIVGINTSQGQATYHYHIDPYWDMFDVDEIPRAPEWDGHTPDEAIERLYFFGKSRAADVLDLDFYCEDLGKKLTIREYLTTLLLTLWKEAEGFSGKRPFGNSGWKYDLFEPLIMAQLIDGKIDEDGYIDSCDANAGDELIADAIKLLM